MTFEEWLSSESPTELLEHLGSEADARKLRLFLVACARSVLPADADRDMLHALTTAENFADGRLTVHTLNRARNDLKDFQAERARRWPHLYTDNIRSCPAWHATRELMTKAAREGAESCAWASRRSVTAGGYLAMEYPTDAYRQQAAWLRDLFGNPFTVIAFEESWRTETVLAVASQMYDSHDFRPMPILADALEDAGCENLAILEHCRGTQPHARGCWVVDQLLGKP